MRGRARETEPERDVYNGGAGPTGITNAGGGDGGARLTEAEGVVLRKACVGETTSECCDNDGGARELTCGRSEMERDCRTSAYCGPYYDVRRAENKSAYSNASETNENSPATRRTRSPSSPNGDQSPCTALRV